MKWDRILLLAASALTCGMLGSGCSRLVTAGEPPPSIERGRYLVQGIGHCFQCHSELDRSKPGFPPVEGREGAGRIRRQTATMRQIAPNLTPDDETGIGRWTDDQLVRAIREGIGHDGRRLTSSMPWPYLSVLTDTDVRSIVLFLRSIKPIRNELPPSILPDLELDRARTVAFTPPVQPARASDLNTPVKRGEYLVRVGKCADCHTPTLKDGTKPRALLFSGGPFETAAVSNITPDPSGIPYYDAALFIQTMRTGKVGGVRELYGAMPWWWFRNMTDDDLRAIFEYLRTLQPVKHRVSSEQPFTYCKLCEAPHGMGDMNDAAVRPAPSP